ncbi:uncharacterized protein LOC133739248 isoform X1 [Rosa rugosa]|uniref:uncharacterized protein LOC133739248 isoform X1 n=1 Tax=Rosa rugosa TaxID=74645 RepID=UPI002B4051DD|nr:uncharacterized protein LOC133739248 isoform X1 [Rosa rugosa]
MEAHWRSHSPLTNAKQPSTLPLECRDDSIFPTHKRSNSSLCLLASIRRKRLNLWGRSSWLRKILVGSLMASGRQLAQLSLLSIPQTIRQNSQGREPFFVMFLYLICGPVKAFVYHEAEEEDNDDHDRPVSVKVMSCECCLPLLFKTSTLIYRDGRREDYCAVMYVKLPLGLLMNTRNFVSFILIFM